MTIPYSDAIKKPASQKTIFAKLTFIKHFYAWVASGTPGIWYQSSSEPVERLSENDVNASKKTSFAALDAASVASVGAWFYDASALRLYYKSITGTDAFDNFVIGDIVLRMSQFPVEDTANRPHDPRIITTPTLSLAISQIFESKAGQVGSGTMQAATGDNLFSRTDFEIDGQLEVYETIL